MSNDTTEFTETATPAVATPFPVAAITDSPMPGATESPSPVAHDHDHATAQVTNSTDATQGEPLGQRARTRQAELEQILAATPESELRVRKDIETALGAVTSLMSGDPDHLAASTGLAISSKHLGPESGRMPATPSSPPTPSAS